MSVDRPIIFRVIEVNTERKLYSILTSDRRGVDENCFGIYSDEIYKNMLDISQVFNDKGYAVLFEVV